jgi:hypothetical protein
MPCWTLTPIDHRCEIWKTYPLQRIVVKASAQLEGREKVARAAPEVLQPNPWLDLARRGAGAENVSRVIRAKRARR